MTVSEVFGAHAAAQIALAQASDGAQQPPTRPAADRPGSFTRSWASDSVCIGWAKAPQADQRTVVSQ